MICLNLGDGNFQLPCSKNLIVEGMHERPVDCHLKKIMFPQPPSSQRHLRLQSSCLSKIGCCPRQRHCTSIFGSPKSRRRQGAVLAPVNGWTWHWCNRLNFGTTETYGSLKEWAMHNPGGWDYMFTENLRTLNPREYSLLTTIHYYWPLSTKNGLRQRQSLVIQLVCRSAIDWAWFHWVDGKIYVGKTLSSLLKTRFSNVEFPINPVMIATNRPANDGRFNQEGCSTPLI